MPGPPPPCGMANVLCRLRWQTSAPIERRAGQPDLRVHVGAVHVDLAAVRVHDGADVADGVLEHAVRRGIGDHQRRQVGGVLRRPWPRGRRRRCCRPGREATTTTRYPAITALAGLVPCAEAGMSTTSRWPSPRVAVPGADHQQAGQLALRAGVGLQRDGGKAGDLGQRRFELAADLPGSPRSGRPARTDACARTRASSPGTSRWPRSASSCTSRAGSSRRRGRCPCARAASCSASSRSRSDADGTPGCVRKARGAAQRRRQGVAHRRQR